MEEGRIGLLRSMFQEKEKTVVSLGGLTASIIRWDTGVYGVRLSGKEGYVSVLPFMGQQIWDAEMGGRRLTMKSMFDRPKPTDYFLHTYGCFMMHCGALRMGCPGPEDDHQLHGELPCAPYQNAEIIFGRDDAGAYIGVTGSYDHDVAFSSHYTARPEVILHEDSAILDINMAIENRASYPMDLMYMCHINYLPVVGGRIVQSIPWDREHMVVRSSLPEHTPFTDAFADFLKRIVENPKLTETIRAEDEYKPEVAIFIRKPWADEEGWSHFVQVHPDGTGDYVGYKPDELDHSSRWIMRTDDQQALGIALPATCDPEGYTAEKKKGALKSIQGKDSMRFHVRTGYLSKPACARMNETIGKMGRR